MNILERIWINEQFVDRSWKPCDICGDPIRDGNLCNDCWEVNRRLSGFMLCQNGIDYVTDSLSRVPVKLSETVDGCVHTRPILISAYLGELEPDQEPYESGVLEEMDTISAQILLTGHYCANCDTLLDIEAAE